MCLVTLGRASVEEDHSSLSLHLTYGINHAGLSCEGLLCCGVVKHMEGDYTTPCCPDVHDATKFGRTLRVKVEYNVEDNLLISPITRPSATPEV